MFHAHTHLPTFPTLPNNDCNQYWYWLALMSSVHPVRKRRVSSVVGSRLDSVVSLLVKEAVVTNAIDILQMTSHKLVQLCHSCNITLTYQEVQELKDEVSAAFLSNQANHWSSLPDLFAPSSMLPRKRRVYFGISELDALYPCLPHPSFMELLDSSPLEGPNCCSFQLGHEVAMIMAISSAARGSRVLLVDTGIGSEIEQLLAQKCSDFCQRQDSSDFVVEEMLARVIVQRFYDPFSLLEGMSVIPSLPLHSQPDIVILMDWMHISVPFMTNVDLLRHRRQFGLEAAGAPRDGKGGCKTSLQPLLAELVLSLQKLTLPRPAYTSQNILTGESKSTSVVIQTAMLHPSQREGRVGSFNGADSNSRKLQCPFGYLLTDVVDYSMRLTTQSSPTSMCNTFQCSADVQKCPELQDENSPQLSAQFRL